MRMLVAAGCAIVFYTWRGGNLINKRLFGGYTYSSRLRGLDVSVKEISFWRELLLRRITEHLWNRGVDIKVFLALVWDESWKQVSSP
jgi:hypothetical protein